MDDEPWIELDLDADAEARRQEILRCKAEGTELPPSNSVKHAREWWKMKRETGICYGCKNQAVPGKTLCDACRKRYNEKQRLKYVRK